MSDLRKFCVAFMALNLLLLFCEWCGLEVRYTGLEALLARFLISFGFAASIVAIWGSKSSTRNHRTS